MQKTSPLRHTWLALVVAAASFHCSSTPDPDGSVTFPDATGGTDATPNLDAGTMDATPTDLGTPDAGGNDAGTLDAGGDGNDDFDTAATIALNATFTTVFTIAEALDRDFYKVEITTANSWIRVFTNNGGSVLDPVIRLYLPDRTLFATNDDAIPRADTNSEAIFRAAVTGTYFIEVLEFGDFTNDMPEGSDQHRYRIQAQSLDPAMINNLIVDPETGDNAASAAPLEIVTGAGFLFGSFRDATDVDVYSFTIPAGPAQIFGATFMPAGPTGYGATTPAGQIWVKNVNTSSITARIDQSMMYDEIEPSLPPGNYHMFVRHPGTTAGSNDYYIVKMRVAGDNPPETAETANNAIGGAEAITLTADGAGGRTGFILAHVGAADVDHFSIAVLANDVVTVACGSGTGGSGVLGLEARLVDGANTTLVMASETLPAGNIFIEDQAIATAGTYFLRLSKTGQSAEVFGDWVRCGMYLVP